MSKPAPTPPGSSSTSSTPVSTTREKGLFWRTIRSQRWLVLHPITVGILIVILMVRSTKEIPRAEVPERSVQVSTVEAQHETLRTEVVGYGTAKPARSWTAIAEVSGRIVTIHPALESGNWIKAGETLVTIDEKDYQLRLTQRLADLDSANASLAELLASEAADKRSLEIEKDLLAINRKEVERTQRLRTSKAASTSALEQAESNRLRQVQAVQRLENSLSLYPSRIAAAEAKVAMSESSLDEARRNVDRTVIKSPINGVLSGADIEVGQFLQLNQQLFEIQDTKTIEIEAQLSLAQLKQLQPVQDEATGYSAPSWLPRLQAEVTTQSGARTFRWNGRAVRLTESVDEQTRTIGLVVEVTNEPQDAVISLTSHSTQKLPDTTAATVLLRGLSDVKSSGQAVRTDRPLSSSEFRAKGQSALKSGTYCEVRLIGAPQSRIIAIPRTAMDGEQVYIVDADQRLQTRAVRRGDSVADRVIIESGIVPGDRIIVRPPIPAIEGMLVRLR